MTAGLVFGVGTGDEDFGQRGYSHLIQHMALRHGDEVVEQDGFVDITTTSFFCTGPRDNVSQAFRNLLRALRSMPRQELVKESQTLLVGASNEHRATEREALSVSFGFQGPGAAALPEVGMFAVQPEFVDGWRQRHFTKQNAAAFFHGPRPESISFVDLATGAPVERSLSLIHI